MLLLGYLRDLRHIRRYLTLSVAIKPIATALVASRLDNQCNSFFPNIAFKDVTKLQPVKSCLARVTSLVTRCPRFTPSMASLRRSWRLCIVFLSYIVSSLRYVPLLTMHFPVSSSRIYIHCLLLQENLFRLNHLVLIYFVSLNFKLKSIPLNIGTILELFCSST